MIRLTRWQLGNYLGMFLPFLDLQKNAPSNASIYLSIVGLHAITMPQSPEALTISRRNMLASLLACGVDPDRTCVYMQEDVRDTPLGVSGAMADAAVGQRAHRVELDVEPHHTRGQAAEDDYLEGKFQVL